MSASDAAPLPRLGEVYFDVRGESRSMRLSWYADTGVAVFSIWQGGTCTGTFRLPIADLPRMVQALQRGPDGEEGGVAPRPAAGQAHRGSPVRDLQPGMPDSAIETGQRAVAPQRPRSGRHHGDDLAAAGYGGDAASEYGAEPTAAPVAGARGDGYPSELDAGYSGTRPPSRRRDELTAEYEQAPGGGFSGGRRAGEHRTAGYGEEPAAAYDAPAGVYREAGSGGYQAPASGYHEAGSGGYREAGSGGYQAPAVPFSEAGGGYDAPTGAYQEADSGAYPAPASGYQAPAVPFGEADSGGGYAEGSHRRGYEGERPYSGGDGFGQETTGPYPDGRLPGAAAPYHDDPLSGGLGHEPTGPYSGDRQERYDRERDRTAAYSHGGYEDEPTGIYHGDLLDQGFGDDPGGRYQGEEYRGGPRDSDYPTGPSGPGYPAPTGPRDYPARAREASYSAARPYVAPRSGGVGPPEESQPRSRRRRGDDPVSDDSFPYGPPPSEREVRGRAR